jgi:hypothetical protein
MDPLVIGVLQRPIIYFMVRSDVFNKYTIPLFNSVQMLPIFREQDGEDTKAKNEIVFKKCSKILTRGRNLLIFGEGFTDDVFIRRLKPVKKGAVRIGFLTLESLNWNKKIYIATVGINYGDPNVLGSDLLISNSNRICLNDFKEEYIENPAKVINDINKTIEKQLQEQITHVEDLKWVFFHEQIMRLRRDGLHPKDTNFRIPLKKRWENSRKLALWMNEQNLNENEDLMLLKTDLENYFKEKQAKKIHENHLLEFSKTQKLNKSKLIFNLLLLLPFLILGLIHFYIPYFWVKRFSEKIMKRRVFWSSVKMFLGAVLISLWNVPIIYFINKIYIHDFIVSLSIYLCLPFIGIFAYKWVKIYNELKIRLKLNRNNLIDLLAKRNEILIRINELIPN